MARVHHPPADVRFVDANGLRFAYREWGAGPLVLLFHGFPDTADTWDRIAPAIAAIGRRVVAVFQRGYAPSGLPTGDTDERTLGEDVLALIAALGGGAKATVIGHDWGAESVNAAVALDPERIERVVTVAIPHRVAVPFTPRLLRANRHFFGLRLPGAEARFRRHDFRGVDVLVRRWSPTWRHTAEDLEPVRNAFAAPGCLHAALGYYRGVHYRIPEFLRRPVEVPALAIGGADDPGCPPSLFERARPQYRRDYRTALIPGGHFCFRESPDAFLSAALPFLSTPL